MTHFNLRAASIAIALSAAASLAQAHNAWLLPSSTVFSKADTVTVDAAVSNDLFVANHAPSSPRPRPSSSCATCST
jgi:hypothetical protein